MSNRVRLGRFQDRSDLTATERTSGRDLRGDRGFTGFQTRYRSRPGSATVTTVVRPMNRFKSFGFTKRFGRQVRCSAKRGDCRKSRQEPTNTGSDSRTMLHARTFEVVPILATSMPKRQTHITRSRSDAWLLFGNATANQVRKPDETANRTRSPRVRRHRREVVRGSSAPSSRTHR